MMTAMAVEVTICPACATPQRRAPEPAERVEGFVVHAGMRKAGEVLDSRFSLTIDATKKELLNLGQFQMTEPGRKDQSV